MPGNAAIYFLDENQFQKDFLLKIPKVQSVDFRNGNEQVFVKMEGSEIIMNRMPAPQMPGHLQGFEGYMRKTFPDDIVFEQMSQRVRQVVSVYGCVIEPALDEYNREFVLLINDNIDSLVFMEGNVFSTPGK